MWQIELFGDLCVILLRFNNAVQNMLKIVQFEVYVQEKGRWTFHARYPGYEWEQALDDARRTEVKTGFPTKIIRDTYDRSRGISEETVAYQSPNAKKAAKQSAKHVSAAHAQTPANSKSKPGRSSGRNGNTEAAPPVAPNSDAAFFLRLIMALGASVIIAGALTMLLSAAFNGFAKLNYELTSDVSSRVLMSWYGVMLLLSAIALNKAFVPWRQMLASRNAKSYPQEDQQQHGAGQLRRAPPAGFSGLKPKNKTSAQEAEREKAIQDVKVLRGDLDTVVPMEQPEPPLPLMPEPQPVVMTPANVNAEPGAASSGTGEQNTYPAHEGGADQPRQTAAEATSASEDENSDADTAEADSQKQAPITEMEMDQLVMVRFIGDVVMSVRSGQGQLDGTTRFGMNLYLAGAASTLADQHGLTPRREKEILSDALEMIGHSDAIRESFLARYDEHLNTKRNLPLIEAGEQDMLNHIRSTDRSTDRPAQQLGSLLEKWDQPAAPPKPAVKAAFLLTYIDIPPSTRTEVANAAMDRHNQEVRQTLSECDGSEVRHTGKGIFAHFDHPDDAICAAVAIQKSYEQQRKSATPLPPARVALVSSLNSGRDSDISGEIFRAADSLCRRTTDAQIATDTLLADACNIPDISFGREIPRAHSGIADGPKAIEVLWQPVAATL